MLLITGALGQLGRCLRDLLGPDGALYTDAADLDITDAAAVREYGRTRALTGIVNCAAYTNVDQAEDEPEAAHKINALGPENLARLAAEKEIPLVHISTDYVFDGTAHSPLKEDAPARPLGVYGRTKRAGEEAVLAHAGTCLVLRTAWLYSPYGKNFLKTMLRLGAERAEIGVVADQIGTPTYAPHLAAAVLKALPQLKPGEKTVCHFTDAGAAGWYDFAYAILSRAGLPCRVRPLATGEYPCKAARPAYSVLDKRKIRERFGVEPEHWTKGVEECLKKLS